MMSKVVMRISAGDVPWGISPGDRFCVSRKGVTRGGGWVHPRGENGVVQPWMGHRMPLLETGWAVFLSFCKTGCRKQPCHLVWPPFQVPMGMCVFFFALEWVGIARANTR